MPPKPTPKPIPFSNDDNTADDHTPTPDPRDIQTLNILSGHKIGAKTSRCLSLLSPPDAGTANDNGKDNSKDNGKGKGTDRTLGVMALCARAPVASKAITIAEIVKRRMGAQGLAVFQYTRVESMLKKKRPRPSHGKGGRSNKKKGVAVEVPTATQMDVDGGGEQGKEKEEQDDEDEEEEEEDPFEPMPDGDERPSSTVRATPVVTIFLSRSQLPSYARLYGYVSPLSPFPAFPGEVDC